MENKPTNELNSILEKTSPGQLENYLRENKKDLANDMTFSYYFKDTLEQKHVKLKDVYVFAGVSESYGSKILSMRSHAKNRDLIIRLCVAGRFTWEETNRALKLYGMTELYSKDPRDACIIVALNNRLYDVYEIDALLEKNELKKISSNIS